MMAYCIKKSPLETTFEVKRRPFWECFEDNWRPIIKSSVVSSNIASINFGIRKMALLFLNLASLSLIFNLYKVYKNQNYNLSNIKEYSIIVCWKAEFCSFSYEMLRISKGKETLTLKGDHLETNFQGFYQKSLHWRPRSPMETSVHNPAVWERRAKSRYIQISQCCEQTVSSRWRSKLKYRSFMC